MFKDKNVELEPRPALWTKNHTLFRHSNRYRNSIGPYIAWHRRIRKNAWNEQHMWIRTLSPLRLTNEITADIRLWILQPDPVYVNVIFIRRQRTEPWSSCIRTYTNKLTWKSWTKKETNWFSKVVFTRSDFRDVNIHKNCPMCIGWWKRRITKRQNLLKRMRLQVRHFYYNLVHEKRLRHLWRSQARSRFIVWPLTITDQVRDS